MISPVPVDLTGPSPAAAPGPTATTRSDKPFGDLLVTRLAAAGGVPSYVEIPVKPVNASGTLASRLKLNLKFKPNPKDAGAALTASSSSEGKRGEEKKSDPPATAASAPVLAAIAGGLGLSDALAIKPVPLPSPLGATISEAPASAETAATAGASERQVNQTSTTAHPVSSAMVQPTLLTVSAAAAPSGDRSISPAITNPDTAKPAVDEARDDELRTNAEPGKAPQVDRANPDVRQSPAAVWPASVTGEGPEAASSPAKPPSMQWAGGRVTVAGMEDVVNGGSRDGSNLMPPVTSNAFANPAVLATTAPETAPAPTLAQYPPASTLDSAPASPARRVAPSPSGVSRSMPPSRSRTDLHDEGQARAARKSAAVSAKPAPATQVNAADDDAAQDSEGVPNDAVAHDAVAALSSSIPVGQQHTQPSEVLLATTARNPSPTTVPGNPASASADPQARAETGVATPKDSPPLPPPVMVQSAHLLERVGQSEMRVGVNTANFGNLELHTRVTQDRVGASITTDHLELRAAMMAEMPSLERAMEQQHLQLDNLNLDARAGAHDHGSSGHQPGTQPGGGAGWREPASGDRQAGDESSPPPSAIAPYSSGLNIHA